VPSLDALEAMQWPRVRKNPGRARGGEENGARTVALPAHLLRIEAIVNRADRGPPARPIEGLLQSAFATQDEPLSEVA
jgi:hypothetical protein